MAEVYCLHAVCGSNFRSPIVTQGDPMGRTLSLTMTITAATGLVIAGLAAAGTAPAGARPGAPTAASQRTQHAQLHATTRVFPKSSIHTSGGAVSLTEDRKLLRYANRSNSPRPAVSTANGTRSLRAASATSWLPRVSPTSVSTRRPGAVTGWQGLNEYDNQKYAGFSVEPPDQGLCAGNGHVVEMINDVVRVDTASGTAQRTAYLNDFFGEPGYQEETDPSCAYDAGSGRFFAVELTLDVNPRTGNLTTKNWLNLAVSKTGNPLGGWRIYRIDVTDNGSNGTPSHAGCPCIGDFPHLATDAHGVFLTTNEYPFSSAPGVFGNNFNGAQVYALSKSAAAGGASSLRVVHFNNIRVPRTSGPREAGFTLWPAQSAGSAYATSNHGTIYFVSSLAAEEARPDDFTGHGNQLGFWSITNTASLNGTLRLALKVQVLGVGSYGIPPLANQKPGPTPLKDCLNVQCVAGLSDPYTPEQEGGLDSSDTRPLTAVFANGTVYAALDTAMLVSNNVQSGFEWFAVGTGASRAALTRHGYVGVTRANAIYPTITTDTRGNGYLGITLSGDKWYPSAAYARWTSGMAGSLNVAAAGKAPEDGFCEYLAFNCAGTPTPQIRPRWGDYGYAAWDGHRFFVANENIANSCSFTRFDADHTCGKTRTFYGNFATHIQVLRR